MALTGQWRCQDNAASTTVVATVGTDGSLTNAGNTSASSVAGPGSILNRAIYTDGGNDLVQVNHVVAGNTTHSIMGWFRMDSAAGTATIGRLIFSSSELFGFIWDHTNAAYSQVSYRAPDGFAKASFGSLSPLRWYHLASVWNGTNIRSFVNGTLVNTAASATAGTATTAISFGNSTNGLNGTACAFADIRTYDSDETSNLATIISDAGALGGDPFSTVSASVRSSVVSPVNPPRHLLMQLGLI